MDKLNLQILGGAWVTASGMGRLNQGDVFTMPLGNLGRLRRQLFTDKPDSRWGRMDRYSKLGVIAASLALQDADIENIEDRSNIAITVSTATGSFEVDHKYYQTVNEQEGLLASPNLFAYTLPNCLLGEIAIRYGLTGPAMVVSQTLPDMMNGLMMGLQCLKTGLAKTVLAGYCNSERGLDLIDQELRPGAVFLVIQQSVDPSPFVAQQQKLSYEDQEMTNIINFMEKITASLSIRLSQ